jgi:hypothetical protein
MSCFVPCPACNRHVVSDETTCPFCAAPLPACTGEVKRKPLRGRMSRAGLFAAGAGAALITVGSCGAAYGGMFPQDSGSMSGGADGGDSAGGGGAGGGGGAPVAEYGAPPAFSESDTKPADPKRRIP